MTHYGQQLAERIDCELKALPELQAPPALAGRILTAVARRAARPWYRQSWPAWPVPMQLASVPVFIAFCGGLGWGAFALARTLASVPAFQHLTANAAGLRFIWRTLSVLGDAAILCCRHVGPGVFAGILAALFLAYAACIGLSTLSLRLALARTDKALP
jgi:hypothetical protein